MSGKKVLVSMTGRVDSTVNAFLLKKQGYDVSGIAFLPSRNSSVPLPTRCGDLQVNKIKEICDQLQIPFYVSNVSDQYFEEVLDPAMGGLLILKSTPVCQLCTRLRIEVLYEKMKKLNMDYISTGHYCKIQKNIRTENYFIQASSDKSSDQSKLLAGLEDKYLSKLLLPLGDLRKVEVLEIAKKFGLNPLKESENSICFKDRANIEKLGEEYLPKDMIRKGQFIREENDDVVGSFKKQILYRVGQKNLPEIQTSDKDLTVLGFRKKTREILVGPEKGLYKNALYITGLQVTPFFNKKKSFRCYISLRDGSAVECVIMNKNNHHVLVLLDEKHGPFTEGESIVFYDKNAGSRKIIGSGNISDAFEFKLIDRARSRRSSLDEDSFNPVIFKF